MSRDSLVGIAPRLLAGLSGFRTAAGSKRFLILHKRPDVLWGPLCLLFNGHQGSFPDLERPGLEVELCLYVLCMPPWHGQEQVYFSE
jgi:hypothetical protein